MVRYLHLRVRPREMSGINVKKYMKELLETVLGRFFVQREFLCTVNLPSASVTALPG